MTKHDKLPRWDLSPFYKSINDPAIDRDFKAAEAASLKFEKKYRKRIVASITPKLLLQALREAEDIYREAARPVIYAGLTFTTRMGEHDVASLKQRAEKTYTRISSNLLFLSLQITNLPAPKLKKLSASPELANYRNFLTQLYRSKPHRLTEPEEKILAQKSLTSSQAFVRLFDEHFAAKKFAIKLNGKPQMLSEGKILDLMRDPKRATRKQAAEAFTAGLQEDSRILTYIFNTLGEDKSISDQLGKFDTPEQSRHLENEIDQGIVDAMSQAIKESHNVVSEYYNLKRKIMGLDKVYDYDRYAPVGEAKAKYTFSEAKDIVLKAFHKFSPAIADAAEMSFQNRWIDAEPRDGKQQGAFCSSGTNDRPPFVLMNFHGRIDDVKTLAHELGHSTNDWLMRRQTTFNYHTALVMAETASVFAEMLVFDDLKAQVKDRDDRLALYMKKIEDMFATVYRQHSMYQFERQFHGLKKEKGELSTQEINAIWRQTQAEMYGKSVTLTPGYDMWWSYIPHFLHTPFYVYAYAFGELLVLSLYSMYKKQGKSFVPKYLELMSAGSTATPQELLKPFGINLKDKRFWLGGIQVIRDLVRDAKRLA